MEPGGAYSNVAYSEVKNLDNSNGCCIYSVTEGHLPSHVRSLSPKCQRITDGKPSGQDTKRTIFTLNCLRFIILVTAILMASCVAIYVSVFKFESEEQETILDRNKTNFTSVQWPAAVQDTINVTESERKNKTKPIGRTPCATRCIPYGAPKFESQCVDNYCECRAHSYQRLTCLPLIDDCIIKKQNADTYLANKRVATFTCHVSTTTTTANTHVIGVYGNHFSKRTVVSLSGSQLRGGTIVLASHYPVRWKIKCLNLDVERVILVSDKQFGSRDLDMDCTTNNSQLPVISSVRVPFGYGDDRYGMDTVNMLKVIRNTFGEIKSFTGAEFADYINVKV